MDIFKRKKYKLPSKVFMELIEVDTYSIPIN